LYFDMPVRWLRTPLAMLYGLGVLALWLLVKNRRRVVALTVGALALVAGWWLTLQPSNTRDWQPDVAQLAFAELNGNQVTLRHIRHCQYRTELDYDVHHYDKTFELDRLRTADLYMVYWGSPHMAHTMVSFGFDGGDYVCFSIETRKEKGEGYSAVRGLFRQFELIYVVADERDVLRLRTDHRKGEEVYLFRLLASPEQARELFLEYVRRLNDLRQQPQWYNALTDNCTTAIRVQRAESKRAPWNWRMLINGHGDELLYERRLVSTNLPLAELKERGHINARARAAGGATDFSQRIRVGVP
jgi:hypothetical protein